MKRAAMKKIITSLLIVVLSAATVKQVSFVKNGNVSIAYIKKGNNDTGVSICTWMVHK